MRGATSVGQVWEKCGVGLWDRMLHVIDDGTKFDKDLGRHEWDRCGNSVSEGALVLGLGSACCTLVIISSIENERYTGEGLVRQVGQVVMRPL